MLSKIIFAGVILFILEFIGFEFSIGPWIFLSVLFLCFTALHVRDIKNQNSEKLQRENCMRDEEGDAHGKV